MRALRRRVRWSRRRASESNPGARTGRRRMQYVQRDPTPSLLVITNMWPEPDRPVYGIFIKQQVEALRAAGVRCDVLYLRGYLGKAVYAMAVPRFIVMSWKVRRRYSIVHVHAGETALIARFLLVPRMVATYHGDDILGYRLTSGRRPWSSAIRSRVVSWHASLFNTAVVQSEEMRQHLPYLIRARSHVIRCGIDDDAFAPMAQRDARAQLGWDADALTVLFAATRPRVPLKRLPLAERAISHAEVHVGPIRLVVAENQSPTTMPLLMNAADCLLVTSQVEGSPQVVKEATLCDLPVVSTDVGDVRDILAGVKPSIICSDDVVSLSEAVIDILRARRRSNGSSKRDVFAQSATVSRLLRVYEQLGMTM